MIKSSLIKRIITALILAPLVIWGLFALSDEAFALASGAIFALAVWEWTYLMNLKTTGLRILYLFLFICVAAIAYYLFRTNERSAENLIFIFTIALLWWFFTIYWILFYARKQRPLTQNITFYSLVGLLIILPCWLAINWLKQTPDGNFLILFLLILVWNADISAYFIGKQWGKTKMIPTVSPGKTREGLYGALLTTMLVATIGGYLLPVQTQYLAHFIILCLITAFFSVIGDLTMSVVKRQQQKKDSGSILPGHGGILDRIDSLNAAAPIFALGLILIGIR